jgi:acetate kinase
VRGGGIDGARRAITGGLMGRAVLTLNAGSSSLKLALFDIGDSGALTRLVDGEVSGIDESPRFTARDQTGAVLSDRTWGAGETPSHDEFLHEVLTFAENHLGGDELACVGHRVVHGGAAHTGPALVTPALLMELDGLSKLAPLHQPHNLAPIRSLTKLRPGLKQTASFDTAFHHTLPAVATRIALPAEYAARGIRRYGFHGLSYTHIAAELRERAPAVASGRVIAAHLGSGASLCAMQGGVSLETSMGFTALDGLVMATRCGSIDPGVLLYLLHEEKMSATDLEDMLYHRSGLLGISGLSGDIRKLHESTTPAARAAIESFVYRIVREVGGLAAVLGGLDCLVFAGGIGEHDSYVRAAVCEGLRWLGVELDGAANINGKSRISTDGSSVPVWIIPADEELTIAKESLIVLASNE